jgi:hypothetical protein
MKIIVTTIICALLFTATPANAGEKWRTWEGMQSGEILLCIPGGIGTFAVARRNGTDGPRQWTTWTHCDGRVFGYRNGRWTKYKDNQTGELLWCYGGVSIKNWYYNGKKIGQWAKCTRYNLGRP